MAQSQSQRPQRFGITREAFRKWCRTQASHSRSMTSRIIADTDTKLRFRLREGERAHPEDIVLISEDSVDVLRFEHGDDARQYHAHRRDLRLCDKTLLVEDRRTGEVIARAGTGTRSKRGPFPV